MATAEAYDQWDDPGLAFSEEQISGYEPTAVAAVRVNELLELIPVVARRAQLGEKAKWWESVGAKMLDVCSWYCVVAELPGIDREGALEVTADGSALRKLTVAARDLGTPEDFLAEWQGKADAEMRQHVSLGRRCASSRKLSGWSKRERSISNRVANALFKEQAAIARLSTSLRSRTKASAKEEE